MKRIHASIWRSLALASLLWVGIGSGGTPHQEPLPIVPSAQAAPAAKRTAAYVFDRGTLHLRDEDAAKLNQLNFSFGLIKDGKASGSHWYSIEHFKAYVKKHSHILPVLSMGGWGADGFSQAAATQEGRDRLVSSTIDLMEQHGFLGLDIDWEYPGLSSAGIASSPDDKQNFTLLLKDYRAALDELEQKDGQYRMLAIALGADPIVLKHIEGHAVSSIIDQINLMTYDLQTPKVASHHTALYASDPAYPLSAQNAVTLFSEAGFQKSKMMIGAAFYGRIYTLSKSTDTPVFASASNNGQNSVLYSKIMSSDRWELHFDDKAKAPYGTDGKSFLTYDDPISIQHKGAFVTQQGLMGIMCWEYGGDDSGELIQAMHDSVQ